MSISNMQFFNDFENIIQIPNALTMSNNNTYTDKRKWTIDAFHSSLYEKIKNNQKSTIDVGLILSGNHYPFKNTENDTELILVDDFKAFQGKKMIVNEQLIEMDLQIFNSIPLDALIYDQSYNLLMHEILPKDCLDVFHERYEIKRKNNSSMLPYMKNILDNTIKYLKNENETTKDFIKVLPTTYYSHIQNSNVLDVQHEMLLLEKIHFVPHRQLMLDSIIMTHDEFDETQKGFDCFLSGNTAPYVYPYRYIAFEKISKSKLKLKILRDNRFSHFKEFQKSILDCKEHRMSKNNLNTYAKNLAIIQRIDYIDRATKSKLAVVCSSVFGYPLRKYFEFMSRGCVIVGSMPKYAKDLGFEHMKNVFECEVDEIENAVEFLLKNDTIRIQIAKNALDLMQEKYAASKVVDYFLSNIDNVSNMYV